MLELGQDKESIWLMWLSICLKIKLEDRVIRAIKSSACSFVILLARCAQELGLCKNFKQGVFTNSLTSADFYSKNWLLAYEGAMRGWFGWKKSDIKGSILESLANEDVHFLDFDAIDLSRITRKNKNLNNKPLDTGQIVEDLIEDWDDIEFDDLDDLISIDMDPNSYGNMDEDEDEDEDEDIWEALGYNNS